MSNFRDANSMTPKELRELALQKEYEEDNIIHMVARAKQDMYYIDPNMIDFYMLNDQFKKLYSEDEVETFFKEIRSKAAVLVISEGDWLVKFNSGWATNEMCIDGLSDEQISKFTEDVRRPTHQEQLDWDIENED